MNFNRPLTLASNSPRRQQLLREGGFDFNIRTVAIEESFPDNIDSNEVAEYLALKKADAIDLLSKDEVLITSDTVVILNDKILGKPNSKEDAFTMLKDLSNKTHSVVTGVCIKTSTKTISFSDTTAVTFKKLSEEEINYYIDNFQPFDKAGSYGIQEWIGMIGITKIEGSYFNVMGLPIHKLYNELANI